MTCAPPGGKAPPTACPPPSRVLALARCKAEEVAAAHPDRLVVGADTMVVLDGRALGKPRDEAEAVEMLLSLQGKTHQVMTGVWVCSPDKHGGFVDAAEVTFYPMTREEAAAYAATGEPLDKAGAYGIQGPGYAVYPGHPWGFLHGDGAARRAPRPLPGRKRVGFSPLTGGPRPPNALHCQ